MKKILFYLLATTALFGSWDTKVFGPRYNGPLEKHKFIGVEVSHSILDSAKYRDAEPAENVVGGDYDKITFSYGYASDKVPQFNRAEVDPYVFVSIADSEKYNETIFGVGLKLGTKQLHLNIVKNYRIFGDFGAGYGKQFNKGDRLSLETNANIVNTATGEWTYGDFKGTFEEDTYVFDIYFAIGAMWEISKNVSLNAKYQINSKYYKVHYVVDGASASSYGDIGLSENEFSVGLQYKF